MSGVAVELSERGLINASSDGDNVRARPRGAA